MRRLADWIRGRNGAAPADERAAPASPRDAHPVAPAEPEPDATLTTMMAVLSSAGFHVWREDGGVSSVLPMRGARRAGDAGDVAGAACDLRIVASAANDAVSCRAVLPDPVPPGRRSAVAAAAMRINASALFGSWELDFDSGALSVRTWTHVEAGSLSPWAATGLLGELHDGCASAAAELCALAFDDADASPGGARA